MDRREAARYRQASELAAPYDRPMTVPEHASLKLAGAIYAQVIATSTVAALSTTANAPAADAFVAFVLSGRAEAILAQHGFTAPTG